MVAIRMRLIPGVILASLGMFSILSSVSAQTETARTTETQSAETRTYATRGPESAVRYVSPELQQGKWATGGSIGWIGGTPDDSALALNARSDYFVADHVSVGPLAQFGITGDMFQFGLSGQGKYWIELPGTNGRGKLALQSGIGFVHSTFADGDTSWLVPIGIGYEHALDSGMNLTAETVVNFTNLHTGRGGNADVMPGIALGLRF